MITLLHVYNIGIDQNMKNDILTAQSAKMKLAKSGFLRGEVIYDYISSSFPEFDKNLINYSNHDTIISLFGSDLQQVYSLVQNLFVKIYNNLTSIFTHEEKNIIGNRPDLFCSIERLNSNIYIIRI